MSGSAFSLLTAGGARFDKKRFGGDMSLFNDKAGSSSKTSGATSKKRKRPAQSAKSAQTAPNFFHSMGGTVQPKQDEPHSEAEFDSGSSSRSASPPPAADQSPASQLSIKLTALSSSSTSGPKRTPSPPLPRSIRPSLPSLTMHPSRPLSSAQGLPLLRALEEGGVRSLWGVQCAAAGVILEGRDLVLCAPTGSGKTLGWLGPILVRMGDPAREIKTRAVEKAGRSGVHLGIRTVVLVPTSALAEQIGEVVRLVGKGRGWKCVVLDSRAGKGKRQTKGKKRVERELCACAPGDGVPIARPEGKKRKGAKKRKRGVELDDEDEEEEEEEEEGSDDGAEDADEDGEEDEEDSGSESAGEAAEMDSDVEDSDAEGGAAKPEAKAEPVGAGVDILISTPKRLAHLVGSGRLSLAQTRHIVLDEADLLHTPAFLPSTDLILHACTGGLVEGNNAGDNDGEERGNESGEKGVLKVFSSATMPSMVERWAADWCARSRSRVGGVRVVVGLKDAPLPSVPQSLLYTSSPSGSYLALLSLLSSGDLPWPSLVFTNTLAAAQALYRRLKADEPAGLGGLGGGGGAGRGGVARVGLVHGRQAASERADVLRRFKEGEVWVLVGTDVLGRGLDLGVGGVRAVVNYECPTTSATYIHRLGRLRPSLPASSSSTAPDSAPGPRGPKAEHASNAATTFYTNADLPYLRSVANVVLAAGGEVPEWVKGVRKGQVAPKGARGGKRTRGRGDRGRQGRVVTQRGGKMRKTGGALGERGCQEGGDEGGGDDEGWQVVGPDED